MQEDPICRAAIHASKILIQVMIFFANLCITNDIFNVFFLQLSSQTPHVDMIDDIALVFVCHFCPSLRFINFHGFINKATINVVPLSGTLINAGATQFF